MVQICRYAKNYHRYNVNPSRSFESSYTDISLKKLTDKLDLYTAQFDIASLQCSASYDSSDNDQETLWIPHAQSLMPAMKHFLEDMSTGAAKVYHEWWLTLVTSQGTFEAKVPVLVVVSPLLKDPNSLFGSTEDELDQRTVVDGDEESVDEKDPLLLYKNSQKAFPGAASERDFAVAAEPHF